VIQTNTFVQVVILLFSFLLILTFEDYIPSYKESCSRHFIQRKPIPLSILPKSTVKAQKKYQKEIISSCKCNHNCGSKITLIYVQICHYRFKLLTQQEKYQYINQSVVVIGKKSNGHSITEWRLIMMMVCLSSF